jgi:hypothetical protein
LAKVKTAAEVFGVFRFVHSFTALPPSIVMMMSGLPLEPATHLQDLPVELLGCIFAHAKAASTQLHELARLQLVSRRWAELVPATCNELELTGNAEGILNAGMLSVPADFHAPLAWAKRFACLRVFEVSGLSASGVWGVANLLCAWPHLEELEIRLSYDPDCTPIYYQGLADDLAETLELLAPGLPRLRYFWLGNERCTHCFGQAFPSGLRHALGWMPPSDDYLVCESFCGLRAADTHQLWSLLSQKWPTAALWWMGERAAFVRCRRLEDWRTLLHRADVHARVAGLGICEWMRERLGAQRHSRAGHRAVHNLIAAWIVAANGEATSPPFRPASRRPEWVSADGTGRDVDETHQSHVVETDGFMFESDDESFTSDDETEAP